MKAKSDISKKFVILEYLPWLDSPRQLFEFNSLEEAEKELRRLEGLITSGSTFALSTSGDREGNILKIDPSKKYEINWYLLDLVNRGYS